MSAEWIPNAEWRVIDRTIASLAKKKGELEVEIGRWLLAAQRERVDRHCGYGSFTEYVERRLGWDARTCREKLRVARALENMPRMRALLEQGERPWSAIREIARVATPETEGDWIEKTERMTTRQRPGRPPSARGQDGRKGPKSSIACPVERWVIFRATKRIRCSFHGA